MVWRAYHIEGIWNPCNTQTFETHVVLRHLKFMQYLDIKCIIIQNHIECKLINTCKWELFKNDIKMQNLKTKILQQVKNMPMEKTKI